MEKTKEQVKEIKPNEKQKECIENIFGKYLVLAGPGTGKTFTVIQRIKNIISKGYRGENILCLTFTDAAANEMKTRLERELGVLDSDVSVYTYHGFCYEIIQKYPEIFEIKDDFKIVNKAISRAFIKECIEEINPKAYRAENGDPYFYIDEILERINDIKKNRLTKEKFFYNLDTNPAWRPEILKLEEKIKAKNGKNDKTDKSNLETLQKNIFKMEELWEFFELYSEKMRKKNFLDFNDMISFVLDKFEQNPNFSSEILDNYEFLLVDEYQDTNFSQNALVFNLISSLKSQNAFVVGDDDQIIYTFQGAKLNTIENFLNKFPETKVICMEENMRSCQNILDAALKVARQDENRLENNSEFKKYNISKNLISKNENLKEKNNKVRFFAYADLSQEYLEIAKEIENLVNSSDCPKGKDGKKDLSQIAILTRTNPELEKFAELLKERNIPFELKEGKNIFLIRSSLVLYYYSKMLINPDLYSDKIFKMFFFKPFSFNPLDIEYIYEEKSKDKSIIKILENLDKEKLKEPEKIEKFVKDFYYLKEYSTNESLKNVVLEIGARTGIFDYYLNSEINKTENISGLKKFIDEAKSFSEVNNSILLEDFIEYLDISIEDNIIIKTDKAPYPMNAIQLSTYYGAKGKEYEYVYMPTLTKDCWESDKGSFKDKIPLDKALYKDKDMLAREKISDRIKVMYVGMTRAKHTLRMSFPKAQNGKMKKKSIFLEPLENDFEREKEPFSLDKDTYFEIQKDTITKREYDYKKEFGDFIDLTLKDKQFAPTLLNTYLNCKRKYLYENILDFAPKDGSKDSMSFGSAIHRALQVAVSYAIKNKIHEPLEEIKEEFLKELKKLPLSSIEKRQILEKRGQKALEKYYPKLLSTPIEWLFEVEKNIKNVQIGDDFYKGFIDRIDKNEDGTYTIYDYKTGSAKALKDIAPSGKWENYYNQIGFYKYLFENSTGGVVSKLEFVFVEEPEKNVELKLTKDDVFEIVEKYKNALFEIKSHDFEPTALKENKEYCKYCPYKDICAQEII